MRCAAKLDRLKCYLLINFFQLVFRSFIRKGLMDRTEGWSKGQDSVWGIFYSESTTVSTSGGWKPGPRDVPRAISFPSAKGCFRIAEPFPPVPGPKRKVVRAFCGPAKGCREGVSEWQGRKSGPIRERSVARGVLFFSLFFGFFFLKFLSRFSIEPAN